MGIGRTPIICPNIWLISTKNQSKKKGWKEIKMNFIDGNGLDLTYYDVDFFGGSSEKTNYVMNDKSTTIE